MQLFFRALLAAVVLVYATWAQVITVEFLDRELTVEEGQNFLTRLKKSGDNDFPFVVIITVTNDRQGDFVGGTQVARFESHSDAPSPSFTVADDDEPELMEMFYLQLTSLDTRVRTGANSVMRVYVPANDNAYGVFSLNEPLPVFATEYVYNSVSKVKVKREVSDMDRVTVRFMVNTSSPVGVFTTQILPVTGTVVFNSQQVEAQIELQILADDRPEDDMSFFVYLTSTSPAAAITGGPAKVIIKANDAPVRFTSNMYRFEEGPGTKIVNVTVTRGIDVDGTLIGPLDRAVFMQYTFSNDKAIAGEDYTGRDGHLNFTAGQTTKEISFTIFDDNLPEIEEGFRIRLFNLQGDAVFYPDTSGVTFIMINANDNPYGIISFKVGTTGGTPKRWVDEDLATTNTTVSFPVERTQGTFGTVRVSWRIQSLSMEDITKDVTPAFGTLVFPEGVSEALLTLTVVNDNVPEPVEYYSVQLSAQLGDSSQLGAFTDAELYIEDSDDYYGIVQFGPDVNQRINVSSSPRRLELSIVRSVGLVEDLNLNVSVTYDDGTHLIESEDVFQTLNKTVLLRNGASQVTVAFDLKPSAFLIIGGEFQATINDVSFKIGPQYGAFHSPRIGQRDSVSVVVSQDAASGETGFFNVSKLDVEEPESGVLPIGLLVSREGLQGQAIVRWSISGKSVTADDVEALQGTITLQPGMEEAILNIGIKADDIPEIAEILEVRLDSIEPSDSQRLRPDSTVVYITINANDYPGGTLQFSSKMNDTYEVEEGGEVIDVIVERTGGNLQDTRVQYVIEPNGTQQFYGGSNFIFFYAGQREKTSNVMAIDDGIPEVTRPYILRLVPSNDPYSKLGERTSVSIIIKGSDNPYGIIQFYNDPTVVYTGEGRQDEQINVTVAVERDWGTFGVITVPWTLTPTPQNDLIPSSGVIVFGEGQSEQNISMIVVNDDIPEGDETFAIQLSAPEGGAISGIPMVATVIILENDHPVVFTEPLQYVTEPQTINLTIRRLGGVSKQGKVQYRTLDGSASHIEGDFTEIKTRELTFAANQQDITIQINILDDDVPEGNETFFVQLFDVGGDMIVTNASTATIVIQANDMAYGVFSFAQPADKQVEEGSTVFFDIMRDKGNFGTVRVYWELRSSNNIPVAAGEDFEETSGVMDFSPQERKRPLGIKPLSDGIPEVEEQYQVVLTGVEVLSGLTTGNLASLATTGIVATVRVLSSDDPYGRMAFAADARELTVAEDFYPGQEASTQAVFIVERRQGSQDQIQVLWEIFSDQLGGNMPPTHDLLFSGQWPSSVTEASAKRRPGTLTPVALLTGAQAQYITVPSASWPALSTATDGFSISAWVMPFPNANGFIFAHTSSNGSTHYLSLRMIVADATTTLQQRMSTEQQSNQEYSVESSVPVGDGKWHHIFVATVNATIVFYIDGQVVGTNSIPVSPLLDGPGVVLVGAVAPGTDLLSSYLQDVRILMRGFDASSVNELYKNTPYDDVTPISGTLTYGTGIKTRSFSVSSRQDIEEEGREVFSVILLDTKGGATLSPTDAHTTLSVLKSDNANGLFGFEQACTPQRILYENVTVTCTVQRLRGDDGTVSVNWIVNQREGQALKEATGDFVTSRGTIVFLPGERSKVLELQVKEDTIPELDEVFEVILTSAVSDDGLVGSTNTSGASIDSSKQTSQVVIQENDYPYGLLQFSSQVGVVPQPGVMISPVTDVVQVSVSEEGGMVPLVVQRAQGTLGSVRAEWRTKDKTALSAGKSPPDYVGGAGSITIPSGGNYAFVNITVKDNSLPEAEKQFEVELVNPTGDAELGPGAKVIVTIEASDGAFGIVQFADSSLSVQGSEDGEQGYNNVTLQVVRLAGSIGIVRVSWEVIEDENDGQDIINHSGILTFQPGETSQSLGLQVRGDTVPELDEVVTVKLLVTSGGELGDPLKTTATVTIAANDDPYGRFVITSAFRPLTVPEADEDVTIRIQRLGGKYGSVRVEYASLHPTETFQFLPGPVTRASTTDFEATQGSVTFVADQEFAEFKLHILDDQLPEQDESVFVRLTRASLIQAAQLNPVSNSPRLGQDSETFGQIIISSNDDASGRLSLSPATLSVDETNPTPAVYVVRTGGTFGEVSVAFRVSDGTAKVDLDYVILSTIVILGSGVTSKRVPVELIDDRVPELAETFTIELLNQVTGGAVVGDQRSTVVTILPSDDPNGVFEFVSPSQTVEEGPQPYTVNITVARKGGSMDVVTVGWVATLNGQPASDDVSPASGSLYFVTNDASLKISLTILADDIPEGAENIVITLVNATNGGRIGDNHTHILTIAPNDSPHGTIELSSEAFRVPEDPADGPQTVQVVRRGGVYGQLRVYYSTAVMTLVDMVMMNNGDVLDLFLQPVSGSVFGAGNQVDLSQSNDTLESCASACTLESSCRSFYHQATETETVCMWYDTTFTAGELQQDDDSFYYEKDGTKVSQLTVNQAKAGEDFSVVTRNSVIVGDGQASGSIPLQIVNDLTPELDEKFYIRLTEVQVVSGDTNPFGLPLLGNLREAVVTITTNDNAFGVFRIFSSSAGPSVRVVEVQETDRLAVDLTVEREGGSIGAVTVGWSVSTANRTARYGQDYIADGATLMFGVEQTRRVISVTILDDNIPEDDEELTVILSNPTAGATLSNMYAIKIVILANDHVAGVLSFERTAVLANEGDQIEVKIKRSLPAHGTVTATWIIQGRNGLSAAQGFSQYTGSLTFLPTETEKTITLDVLSDETPEVNEEYSLTLQNISTQGVGQTGAASLDPQLGTVLVTISGSNDPHGVFQLASTSLEVRVQEAAGSANLKVDRKFGAIGVVRVSYEVTEGSLKPFGTQRSPANAGQDFVAVTSGFIDVGDGVSSGTISVTIVDDDIPEIDEVFVVRLTGVTLVDSTDNAMPPKLASNGTEAEVIILANDGAQGIIQFAPDSREVSVTEQGQTISLTVLRGNGTFGQISVFTYSQAVTESTLQGQDYNLTDSTLVFEEGESRKSIEIVILDDNDPEPAETFEVILANPSNGAVLGQNVRASVTILPNDDSGGVITFDTADDVRLREPTPTNPSGSQADVLLRRGPGAYGEVSVPYTITTALGQLTDDVSPRSGTITFSDRQTTAVLALEAVDDDIPEGEESFTLALQSPTGGAILGNIVSKTISVEASDAPAGSFQIFTSGSRLSNYTVEETFATLEFDVVRSQGTQGRVTVDVMTVPATATSSFNSSRVVLAPLTDVVGVSVSAWCQVTVGDIVYLAMLTSLPSDTQLASLLPPTATVGVGQSILYRWQGQLTYVETFASEGASAATSFTLDGSTYLVVANSGRESKRQVSTIVHRVSPEGELEVVQGLPARGASDVEYFSYSSRHFLFVTNSLDDSSRSDISSHMYEWDAGLAQFTTAPHQLIPTLYARAVTSFTIDGQVYVAVANYYDRSTGSYEISSVVYRMEPSFSLAQHQQLATRGAIDLVYTEAGGMHLLVVANNRQDVVSTPQDSAVYRWDPLARAFVLHQTLKTSRTQSVTALITDAGSALLAFANSVGNSEIFVWDIESSTYKSGWKGSPYMALEPITIRQALDNLYMLASVGMDRQATPTLFQVAQMAEGSDFVSRRVTMTFDTGQSVLQTSAVVLTDDAPEPNEQFSVSLVSPTGGAELGQATSVSVQILSNDDAHGIIEFADDSLSLSVEERDNTDTPVQLNVVRKQGFFGHISASWQATGDHSGVGDITPLSGQVEFANGQSVATITLTVRDDQEAEFAEVTYVRLTQIVDAGSDVGSRGAKLGENTVAVITVLANDSPYGVVSWGKTEVTVMEPEDTDQSIQLRVVRQQGLEQAIRVSYVTSVASQLPIQEQATSGEDFVATQGSVVLPEGIAGGVVPVVIKKDDVPESAESFLVNLTSVAFRDSIPGAAGSPSIAVGGGTVKVTILENDNARGTVEMDVTTNIEGRLDVYEEFGRNVTIELPLKRSVGFFGSVTVTWQAEPIEADVLDFYPTSGTVQFSDQQRTANITITIIDDTIPEAMESFEVRLISINGDATLGQSRSVRVAILPNDSPTGLFRFATSQVETRESYNTTDPGGQARAVVQRVQGTQGLVNVQWRLNAEAAGDFMPPLEGTIQFTQGEMEKAIVLQTRPDTILEGREEFTLSLVTADNSAQISSTAGDCKIIILADSGASGVISILPESWSVIVGEPGESSPSYSGQKEIKLTRGQGIFGEVVVTWSITPRDLSAFLQVEGSVKFLNLQQTASIVLQTRDDSVPELRENFILQINSASGGAVVSTVPGEYKTNITFAASDYPHGLVQFSLPEMVTVLEDDNAVRLTVMRDKGLNGQLQVAYTTSGGSATAYQDFLPQAGTLTFQTGMNNQTIEVKLVPEDVAEGPEDFLVNLTSVVLINDSNDYSLIDGLRRDMRPSLGTLSTKIVRIDKNDNAEGTLAFSKDNYEVKEESGVAQVTITRSGGSYGQVYVHYATQMVTATEDVDYVASSGELLIRDGVSETTLNITLKDDSVMEQSETFRIILSNVTGGALLGSPSTATVTILKSDYPNGRFAFQGPTEIQLPNPEVAVRQPLFIERTGGVLGQQKVYWHIMGPNNPNQQLEDTADISATVGGVEVTFGSFNWSDGEAGTKQLILDIKGYTTWEVEKSFVVELYRVTGSPDGIGDGEVDEMQGKVTIKIERFGDPNGVVRFTGAAEQERQVLEPDGVSPSDLVFPITRRTGTGVSGNIQIFWEVRPVTVNNSDVQPFEGSLILEDGEREGQITLQILPDDIPELTETFTLVLLRIVGGAQIDSQFNQSVFSIRYNDQPHGEFGIIPESQAVEVDNADLTRQIKLNFTRFQGTFGSVILSFTITYDITDAGVALETNTGTVTFSNGTKEAITLIAITGKGFLQLGSTFTVIITDVQYLGAGETEPPAVREGLSRAQLTVPPLAANTELSFATDIAFVKEEDQTLTVSLVRAGTYGSLVADWMAGYAASDLPDGVVNGEVSPASGSVNMAHGQEEANLTVQVNPQIGRSEAFILRLPRSPLSLVSGGAKLATSHLIVHADPSGMIRFSDASLSAQASELDGQVTLTLWRLYGSDNRIAVYYKTVADTAQSALDFQTVDNGILVMDPRQTVANITVQIYQDNIPEQTETFYVNLTSIERFPTPIQPVLSPRLSKLKSLSQTTITESNDPYGILSLKPTQTSVQEAFTTVTLTVMRSGGVFGAVSVRVRTVGGGESWTSQIVPRPDSATNNTIADVLGKRPSHQTATGGLDYDVLDTSVQFQASETEKRVTVTILEDNLAEPMESVLVYLTQPSGGARVARGTEDGGLKGYSVISIGASDLSNGLIGFAESSKNVVVNEDTTPRVTLKLIRLNAFFGEVHVSWKAKKSLTSTDAEDAALLSTQLQSLANVTICPADQSQCDLYVDLKNDDQPEESFTFVVLLTSAGTDAKLNEDSLSAVVNVGPSDDVRGLLQFAQSSREKIVADNENNVRLAVERVKGQSYEVTVGYNTVQMSVQETVSGVTVYPALDGEDFRGQTGSLRFAPNIQELQYIDISLTPSLASSNPLPKQFYVRLSSASNGARIHPTYGTAIVRIADENDVPILDPAILPDGSLSNDTIISVIGQLDNLVDNPLTDLALDVIENVLERVNQEGNNRRLPTEVVTVVRNLYCKLLNSAINDARIGRSSLTQILEDFAYTLLTGAQCPPIASHDLKSTECSAVKISAGRWLPADLRGHEFNIQSRNSFTVPQTLPPVDTKDDGTDDECLDFHLIEYSETTWFVNGDDSPMSDKVVGFGLRGRPSARTQEPVIFRIYTPDRRIAAKDARCVYFDTPSEKWVSPSDVCTVTNDLSAGEDNFVDCSCTHMSSYAVIATTDDDGKVGYEVWFYVICFICMTSMLLAVAVHHLCFSNATFAAGIHMHFLTAVFFTQLCLVIDAFLSQDEILTYNFDEDNSRCIAMGLFFHYFILAQFTWIATQAVNLWKILILNDEHTDRHYIIFFIIGWGVPLVLVAIFYAVTFNIYKYHTDLPVDYIYGDVNYNGELCFITNGFVALGGILVPILFSLLVVGIVFIKAYQLSSQWAFYDDFYHGRLNSTEIPLLLLIWGVLLFTCLWLALHMIYGFLWMMVLFCIFNLTLALLVFVLYVIIRNPMFASVFGPVKASYSVTPEHTVTEYPVPDHSFNHYITSGSIKGSRTSLLNEAWETNTAGGRSRMTVKRALPSQVYINPPIAVVSPAATIESDNPDFDDLIYALKMGHSLTPSEVSRSFDDDISQLSIVLDRYETKRIDIADTHL